MASRWLAVVTIAVLASIPGRARGGAQDQPENVRITQGPAVEYVDAIRAIIAWSTNVNAGTVVHYGTTRDRLDRKAEMPWGGLTHRVTLTGLQPDTQYYFLVESSQGQDTGSEASQAGKFRTLSAVTSASKQAGSIADGTRRRDCQEATY